MFKPNSITTVHKHSTLPYYEQHLYPKWNSFIPRLTVYSNYFISRIMFSRSYMLTYTVLFRVTLTSREGVVQESESLQLYYRSPSEDEDRELCLALRTARTTCVSPIAFSASLLDGAWVRSTPESRSFPIHHHSPGVNQLYSDQRRLCKYPALYPGIQVPSTPRSYSNA